MRFELEVLDDQGQKMTLPLHSTTFRLSGFAEGIYVVVKPQASPSLVALDRGYVPLGQVVGDPIALWGELMSNPAKIQHYPNHPPMASAKGLTGDCIMFDLDEALRKI